MPGHRAAGRRSQADGDGHGLIVLEQQRRQRRPGVEAVAADRSARRVDRVPESTQPLDVVADRARAHLESLGELRARPVARRLEQREQAKQPRRAFPSKHEVTTLLGTKLT